MNEWPLVRQIMHYWAFIHVVRRRISTFCKYCTIAFILASMETIKTARVMVQSHLCLRKRAEMFQGFRFLHQILDPEINNCPEDGTVA